MSLNHNIINVINLPEAIERRQSFEKQFVDQKADFRVWDGLVVVGIPFMGVNLAHKQIVLDARDRDLNSVTIAEDDIIFSAPGAWDYYKEHAPDSFDLYMGMVYSGEILDNRIYNYMAGLTLYTVHRRFYDKYLALSAMNHIDRLLGSLSNDNEFYVCDKFVCEQSDGWSYNKQGNHTYGHLVYGREFFGR